MKLNKKLLSLFLSLVMMLTVFVSPASASANNSIIVDGQTYKVSQVIVDGKTQVTVTGGGETTIVYQQVNRHAIKFCHKV